MAMADEDGFGLEVHQVLEHERGSSRSGLQPGNAGVQQHDPPPYRGGIAGVAQPREYDLVLGQLAIGIDAIDAEEENAGLLLRRGGVDGGDGAAS